MIASNGRSEKEKVVAFGSFNIASAFDSNVGGGSWNSRTLLIRSSTRLWITSILILVVLSAKFYQKKTSHIVMDPFDQKFCDADGTCHESPDVASPRTVYSAWNKEQYDGWWRFFKSLNKKAEFYADRRNRMTTRKLRPLILLGDSITESWLGTGTGIKKERAKGVSKILEAELSSSAGFDPLVLAISGDQTQHLLYRLKNGHMRAVELQDEKGTKYYDPDTIFVVMIGTNNLGAGELPGPTIEGIIAVVKYLLEETAECRVMLFQVLPRGDGKTWLPNLCPPRCDNIEKNIPYNSFLPPIRKVNVGLRERVEKLSESYPSSRIHLVDCGTKFLNDYYDSTKGNSDGNNEVKEDLMPDLLHPNAEGHKILAECIRNYYFTQIDQ